MPIRSQPAPPRAGRSGGLSLETGRGDEGRQAGGGGTGTWVPRRGRSVGAWGPVRGTGQGDEGSRAGEG